MATNDRYNGETEDILKKIQEAGEEPENAVDSGKKYKEMADFFNKSSREIDFMLYLVPLSRLLTVESVETLIKMGYPEAPASTKYHGNHPGGLLEHSKEVATALLDMSLRLDLKWERPESPIIIGFFHDLCKIDQYIQQEDGTYIWNPDVDSRHAEKSIEYIEKYTSIKLTDEERACILHHMGAFGDKEASEAYSKAIKEYPNVLYTHTADMIASQIKDK